MDGRTGWYIGAHDSELDVTQAENLKLVSIWEVTRNLGTWPWPADEEFTRSQCGPLNGDGFVWGICKDDTLIGTVGVKNGGLLLDIQPGTDLPVVLAIARVIVENGWEDNEWIQNWVNNKWESSSGFGQGTRNTPWQWRTTWGKFQTAGFEDWKEWLLSQDYSKPEVAAEMAQIDVEKIYTAAE